MSEKTTPTAGTGAVPGFPEPKPQEAMFFFHVISSNKAKLDVDWNEVARKGGYANGSTASVRFGQIKRRLGLVEGTSPAPKKTPTKARAKKEVGSGTNTTPSKVTKNRTPKKEKVSKAATADFLSGEVDDDENFMHGKTEEGYGDEDPYDDHNPYGIKRETYDVDDEA